MELHAADAELRLLKGVLSGIDDGFTVQDERGNLIFVNESGARLVGFSSPEEMLAQPAAEIMRRFVLFSEDGQPFPLEKLPSRAVLAGKQSDAVVVQHRAAETGETRWSHVRAYPVHDADGKLARVINVFRDVTDEHHAEARRKLLLRAVEGFNASLDYNATLKTIAREIVPSLADWCAVDLMEGDELRRLAVTHVDPAKVALVEEMERRYPPDPDLPGSPRNVMKSGKPFLLPVIPQEMLRAAAKDAEHGAFIDRLGLHSAMTVPIIGRRGPLGALSLVMAESRRVYTDDDVAFVATLADRAAIAIENAMLVRELEQAAAREMRARELLERMQAIIAAMSGASTPAEVAEAVCRIGGQAMGAYAAHLWLVQADGSLHLTGTWPASDSMVDQFRTVPPDANVPSARVARTRVAEWIETDDDFVRACPEIYAAAKAAGRVSAFAVIPVSTPTKFKGVLSVAHHLPHSYKADERAFYIAVAEHCAQSLQRARLFAEQQSAREEAERAARFSEMFIGMVSHDLRNPLSAIGTSAQLVLITATDERQRRPAARIVSSMQRMARMIDQLLDFTRIRLGKGIAIEPTFINLGELASQIAEEIESAHPCAIEIERQGDTAGEWDGDRLSQVLSNLFANAAIHGKNGSPIVVRIDGRDPHTMRFEIRNDGQIADDLLPVIFEPFRAGKAHHSQSRGLGLGLYIAHEIVRSHGGTINAARESGGTVFKIEIPRAARRQGS